MANAAGFATTDRLALQFNADTGANYQGRSITVAAGGSTLTNVESLSAASMPITFNNLAGAIRTAVVNVSNVLVANKVAVINAQAAGGSASAAPVLALPGAGTWFNTSAQITRVDLVGFAGNNLLAGTALAVFGRDF